MALPARDIAIQICKLSAVITASLSLPVITSRPNFVQLVVDRVG